MKMIYCLPCIVFCLLIYGCHSNKVPDKTNGVMSANTETQPVVHETQSTLFLRKMNDRLLADYNNAKDIEAKIAVLSRYETEMNTQLQKNNHEIDSIPVHVEEIDSALTDFLYLRFSNPYADFVCSLQKETIDKNGGLKQMVRSFTKGTKTLINFKVLSLKVHEPANILPPFEMEGNLLEMKGR